jgi:hypothetical protein
MKYDAEVVTDAMIYVPRFIKTSSGIQKLMEGREFTDKQTARR